MATDVTIQLSTPDDVEITLTGEAEAAYLKWRSGGLGFDVLWSDLMAAISHQVEMSMDITDFVTDIYE